MAGIRIDLSDVKRYERLLRNYTRSGLPFAVRNTLNDAAFETLRRSRKRVKGQFINRNNFTLRSLHVVRARGISISAMRAEVGSSEGYMADQEFGGIRRPGRGKSTIIPTTSAAGQGISNIPRKRTVRNANQLQAITLKAAKYRRKTKGMPKKQAAVVTMAMARRENDKFVFLNLPWGAKARGIFKLMGSRRKPKIRLIHDMSRKRIPISQAPWLKPSTDQTIPRMPRLFARRAGEQLRRAGLR